MVRIYKYTTSRRAAFLECWNRCFSDRPNFVTLNPESWKQRVEDCKGRSEAGFESFHAGHLFLAVEKKVVLGFIHIGLRPEAAAKVYYADWPGGEQKYIACFATRPERRREGIAATLWDKAMSALRGSDRYVIDGQCFNPFYGNSDYPFTPFWGTPEGISIFWDDQSTRNFLKKRGFGPRFKAISLEANLRMLPPVELRRPDPEFRFECRENVIVRLDQAFQDAIEQPLGSFLTVCVLQGDIVRGYVTGYMMTEVRPDLAAIYEMNISEHVQGRGLGGNALKHFFSAMKQQGARYVQTLTVPNLSPNALGFYEKHGFLRNQEWAIY